MVSVVVGIGGVDGDFYAFIQRDATLDKTVVGAIPNERVPFHRHDEHVSVFVDIVKSANNIQVTSLASSVWFEAANEVDPCRPASGYLGLLDGRIKVLNLLP